MCHACIGGHLVEYQLGHFLGVIRSAWKVVIGGRDQYRLVAEHDGVEVSQGPGIDIEHPAGIGLIQQRTAIR